MKPTIATLIPTVLLLLSLAGCSTAPTPTDDEVLEGAVLLISGVQMDPDTIRKEMASGKINLKITTINKYTKMFEGEKVFSYEVEYADPKTGQRVAVKTLRMVYRGTSWYYYG